MQLIYISGDIEWEFGESYSSPVRGKVGYLWVVSKSYREEWLFADRHFGEPRKVGKFLGCCYFGSPDSGQTQHYHYQVEICWQALQITLVGEFAVCAFSAQSGQTGWCQIAQSPIPSLAVEAPPGACYSDAGTDSKAGAGGFFHRAKQSLISAGCPTTRLSSNTVYLERVSSSIG